MDNATTTINREYALRFLGVALLFIAFAGWFLYDGFCGYPAQNARVAPVAQALAKRGLTAVEWMNDAKTGTPPLFEAFREAGLDTPSKYADGFQSWIRANDPRAGDASAAQELLSAPLHSADEIRTQFISAGIGLLAALVLLGILAVRMLTRFSWDGKTLLRTFAGATRAYALEDLTAVDGSQWAKRGIYKAQFKGEWVVLDAWHHAGVRPIAEALIAHAKACNIPGSAS